MTEFDVYVTVDTEVEVEVKCECGRIIKTKVPIHLDDYPTTVDIDPDNFIEDRD